MRLGAAAHDLAEQITALGVATTVDPTVVAIPGGWLTLRYVRLNRLDGATYEVPFTLYLIAGDFATPAVLDELGRMLELVAPVTSGEVEAVTLSLPNHAPHGLPALAVPIAVDVTDD